jgi:hypothetical protein
MEEARIVRVFPVANSWIVSRRRGYIEQGFEEKAEAECFARQTAQRNRPSLLVVLSADAKTEYERTYS